MKQTFVIDLDQSIVPFWLGQLNKKCLRHGWVPVCGCIQQGLAGLIAWATKSAVSFNICP